MTPPARPGLPAARRQAATGTSAPRQKDEGGPLPRDTGLRAESAAADYLQAQGFEIVGRNLRLGALELDLVARREDLIAIVEVRYRSAGAWSSGFGSIDAKKRRRIRRAGERLWNRRYRNDASVCRLRFDAASVRWEDDAFRVEYVPAAF